MKKLQRKVKGFTLTELAIVIAVIAILIAVLVPTFTSLINKSRESSDSQLAKNMNTLLSIAGAESTPTTMGEVNAILEDGGYKLENLNPTADGNIFVWDENSNTISYIDEDGTVLYAGNSALTTGGTFTAVNNYWLTVKTASDISDWSGVSYYIASDTFVTSTITIADASRIDTGDYTVGTVEYSSSATSSSVTAAKTAVGKNVKKLAAENLGTDTAAIRGIVGTVNVSNENISVVNYAVVTTMSVTTATKVTNSSTGKVTTLTLESSSGATLVNDGYVKTLNDNSCTVTNNGYVSTATNTTSITSSNSSSYEYTIASYNELLAFSTEVNGGATFEGLTVKLTADITANSSAWTPIGNSTRASGENYAKYYFAGTFDGQGYSISGITYENDTDKWGASIFGVIKGATIKNVVVKNCSFTNTADTVAGLIAFDLSENGQTTTIENITIDSSVSLTGANAGGIIARLYGTTSTTYITKCYNYASMYGTAKAGGIAVITESNYVTIENCYNYGDIAGNDITGSVGGILAYAKGVENKQSVTINNCVNYGALGSSSADHVGGICGYLAVNDTLYIDKCTNEGAVTGSGVGGILGVVSDQTYKITNCTNNGTVTGESYAGGIAYTINSASSVISGCINTATITADDSTGAAGGVVGKLGSGTIENCSGGGSGATITAAYAGRLIGAVATGNAGWAKLEIDDTNGDDYSSLSTVGVMGNDSSWGKLIVVSGTFYGLPQVVATSYLRFRAGTTWVQSSDENGTISITTNSVDYDTTNNYGVTYGYSSNNSSSWSTETSIATDGAWTEDDTTS